MPTQREEEASAAGLTLSGRPAAHSIAGVVQRVCLAFPRVQEVRIRGEYPEPVIEIVVTVYAEHEPDLAEIQDWADMNRPLGGPLWRVVGH